MSLKSSYGKFVAFRECRERGKFEWDPKNWERLKVVSPESGSKPSDCFGKHTSVSPKTSQLHWLTRWRVSAHIELDVHCAEASRCTSKNENLKWLHWIAILRVSPPILQSLDILKGVAIMISIFIVVSCLSFLCVICFPHQGKSCATDFVLFTVYNNSSTYTH